MNDSSNNFHLVDYFPQANYWEEHDELFKSKNVIIKASSDRIEYPKHWGVLSIKTVLKGNEVYFVNDNEYKLNEGNYLILNHDQYYGSYIRENSPTESLSFHFTRLFEKTTLSYLHQSHEALVDDPFSVNEPSEPGFTVTQHNYSKPMRELVVTIKELTSNIASNSNRIEELYYQLYTEIFYAQAGLGRLKQNLRAIKKSTRDEVFNRVTVAKDYIESNFCDNDLSLSVLAKVSCMNSCHFLRCFSQVYGMTPYQYIKNIRLERAFNLLKRREYAVSTIVNLCGYQDVSSFDRAFKAKFKLTPTEVISA